jgi:hypothetical protein
MTPTQDAVKPCGCKLVLLRCGCWCCSPSIQAPGTTAGKEKQAGQIANQPQQGPTCIASLPPVLKESSAQRPHVHAPGQACADSLPGVTHLLALCQSLACRSIRGPRPSEDGAGWHGLICGLHLCEGDLNVAGWDVIWVADCCCCLAGLAAAKLEQVVGDGATGCRKASVASSGLCISPPVIAPVLWPQINPNAPCCWRVQANCMRTTPSASTACVALLTPPTRSAQPALEHSVRGLSILEDLAVAWVL